MQIHARIGAALMPFSVTYVFVTIDSSAGRYQKLLNSIYCLSSFHDMNKYCLSTKSAKFCSHHMISHHNSGDCLIFY